MSKIDDYSKKRGQNDPLFASEVKQSAFNLDAAVAVTNLRKSLHLNQREFAALVGKPQSTISRIEHGSMNVSTQVLSQIAAGTHQRLKIQFI